MRFKKACLVFSKDYREVRRNWQVILPIVIVPLLFSILLPAITILIPSLVEMPGSSMEGMEEFLQILPSHVKDQLGEMTGQQIWVYVMNLYFFAPFFLIIPLMASSVIASDSFAGEKERKTIEALLATPISDSELFLGKILVSFVPSMIVTVVSFLIYTVVVDVISFSIFNGALLLPNLSWIMLIFGLAPVVALTSIGLTVLISARVKGFREAQQISVVLLIPILALLFAQLTGALFLGPMVILVLIAVFAAIVLFVFRISVKLFGREKILTKLA